ncbi:MULTISPECIES: PLP-dependent aminotransferase family protein [Variovorax]|jgi:GntR family transcriptional regulator / MocR family aminotransferase|uniref:MocR-like pyridoxine biosynthesis transcription factor PdxR n=1 Tax=Variovorax TaxID=34072 RepID=UPI00086AE8E1|nr:MULTISPECIES: PLP-dependent aminotransferase family protein [Variovorax]MBN8752815.1 PLP-dependent aminotransferase family protein [Variovorax sp.]ODU16952.1 MAG: DNA-binding protein [Variovorax sp. SCN 67-85]ODV23543.1 MAG: DNA-binding protein [Variovorax sp. SCN 67-20]OJZ15223.1 MAG: DNA-binding protein [Variovorax sp. 67-131]UKI07954.1 PLP-dependent aminotransferase family protein [Variovorax paradoxus]
MDYSALLAAHAREDPNGPATRQHRLYAGLRWAILGGQIAEGTRLPSTRALAEELGMARNSVLYAYEHLGTEGFLRSSRHGTVVAQLDLERGRGAIALDAARACTPTLSRRALALQTEQDDANRSLPLWPGMPALDAFPLAAWRRCMERAWRHAGARQLGYAPVQGHLPLRQAIAQYLRVSRGVRCTAEQVFISDGSQGGLELCARTLADVGDTAWIENPGYPGARAAFQAADLRLVPIGVDDEGLAPSAEDWRATPPRLIYITPSHQYPLGAMMSLERRLALIRQAREAGAWLIEDDYDSEFRSEGLPLSAVQGLDAHAPVVYVGTFSKTLFPALRLGFMVVPAAVAPALLGAISAAGMRGRLAEQVALADFIESGQFTLHLRRMRQLYGRRREALQEALQRHLRGVVTVSGGAGGMHLSVRLHTPVPDTAVSRAARAQGLGLRPLSLFCLPGVAKGDGNGFVLGYAGMPPEHADELVRRMGRVIAQVSREAAGG